MTEPTTEAGRFDRLQEAIEGERRFWHTVEVRPDDLSALLEYVAAQSAALDVDALARAEHEYDRAGWLDAGPAVDDGTTRAAWVAREYRAILAGETERIETPLGTLRVPPDTETER